MDVSRETPAATEARLRGVVAAADLDVLPGLWWYDEFAPHAFAGRVRADAVALVRDADGWSQLVPVAPGDAPAEPLRVWAFHFPPGVDNSGFVGWLATRVKQATGSGVAVVCGQNAGRGGIYDYWACPAAAGDAVLAAVEGLRAAGPGAPGPGGPFGVRVDGLDHLVLTVRDVEATVAFYARVLGMEPVTFGGGRRALHFGDQKLNLHPADAVPDPNVRHATPGSADLCFLTRVPLEAVVAHLAAEGVPVVAGPVVRTGARGPIRSVYCYDPDENLVEIANALDPAP